MTTHAGEQTGQQGTVNGQGPPPSEPAVELPAGGERVMALVLFAAAAVAVAMALDLLGVPVFDALGGLFPRAAEDE